ncbi:MAG: hypothetical protein GY851_35455 [bacterium]|nr:hypothetical protein [bacterium]
MVGDIGLRSMASIRDFYGVPAKRGAPVVYRRTLKSKKRYHGRIKSASYGQLYCELEFFGRQRMDPLRLIYLDADGQEKLTLTQQYMPEWFWFDILAVW